MAQPSPSAVVSRRIGYEPEDVKTKERPHDADDRPERGRHRYRGDDAHGCRKSRSHARASAQLRDLHNRSASTGGLVYRMWRRDSRYGVDERLLDSDFELLDARGWCVRVVNARDAKHVPGRKTVSSHAQWLQRLHPYGLSRASFRPKGQIAELRAYVRQRERLLEYAASHIQHMQKALTETNLQLDHVVADVTGATGLRMIRALLAGERDPRCRRAPAIIGATLVLRRSRLRSPVTTAPAHCSRWSRHSLVQRYKEKASACDARIEAVEELSISRGLNAGPLPSPRRRLHGKANGPDFDVRAALGTCWQGPTRSMASAPPLAKLIAECGDDLSAWPSAKHLPPGYA